MKSPIQSETAPRELASLLEPVAPLCPHFGPCGGCQLQHIAYDAQLAGKAHRLRLLLTASVADLPKLELHASPPFGYRNRIRLTLAKVDGVLRAGYLAPRANSLPVNALDPGADADPDFGPDEPPLASSSQGAAKAVFLPITQCPIAAPILRQTSEAFLSLAADPAGSWLRDRHVPDQLELFTHADQSRLNLTLSLRTNSRTLPSQIADAFTAFCAELQTRIPALSGAGISLLPANPRPRSRRGEAPRPGPIWGASGLNYTIDLPVQDRAASPAPAPSQTDSPQTRQLAYWVPRTAFFQVNHFLLPELVALVAAEAAASPGTSLAWDLYAGAGLFSRPLAEVFGQVTAVEIAEAAYSALAATRIRGLHAVKSTTLEFLRAAVLQRERPDLVLLDPPRSGAGAEVCTLLGRIAARTLIYISCSPGQLAQDLRILTANYTVSALHLADLFPQTTHIETVAILTRRVQT